MATIETARLGVCRAYDELRRKSFGADDTTQPALLRVEENNRYSSGYSSSQNELVIYLSDGDLEDWELPRLSGHPPWVTTLIHEIVHEYQHKRVRGPSKEGVTLMSDHKRPFDGQGHDEQFYTAIAAIAPAFNLTPEQFLQSL